MFCVWCPKLKFIFFNIGSKWALWWLGRGGTHHLPSIRSAPDVGWECCWSVEEDSLQGKCWSVWVQRPRVLCPVSELWTAATPRTIVSASELIDTWGTRGSGLWQEAEETCLTSAPEESWTTWRIFCMNIGNTDERVIGGYPSWEHWIEWNVLDVTPRYWWGNGASQSSGGRISTGGSAGKILFCFSIVIVMRQ